MSPFKEYPTRLIFLVLCGGIGLLVLSSCRSAMISPTASGEQIQLLAQPEEYPQCLFINKFRAMTLTGQENSYQQALIKIKNKVAVRDGTHLTIESSITDDLATTIIGTGYRCPLTEDGRIRSMTIKTVSQPTSP